MKKLGFWLILLAFLYGLIEATAWLGYRIVFGEPFSFGRVAQARQSVLAALAVDAQDTGKVPAYLVHPYYGHIMNPNWFEAFEREIRIREPEKYISEPMNAWGFVGSTSPILPASPARFIVAISGGSVAAYAGTWGRQAFVEGISKIAALKGRQVELLNFGTSAYKQPQQLMVMGDILAQGGHIDLLINIDGFNEIALPRGDDAFGSGVSPFFPQPWRVMTETSFSRDDMARLGRIALLAQSRASWANYTSAFGLRYSVTANTLWQLADSNFVAQKQALEQLLMQNPQAKQAGPVPTTADARSSLGPAHGLKDARELYRASAGLWARSSALLNNMIASQGGLYIHVLQPNLHFPGSRPPAAADARFNTGLYRAEVEVGYPYLRSAGQTLLQSGVHFNDLTLLFKDDPGAIYTDTCCHFTLDGNAKLVKAIVERVTEVVGKNEAPHLVRFAEADYSAQHLRSLAVQPKDYHDGSGVALKRP